MKRALPMVGFAVLASFLVSLWLALPAAHAQTQASMRPDSLAIGSGTKTATATAGAATLSKGSGVITTEALTTVAGASYTLTLTNTTIAATDMVFASVALGTATTGSPAITSVKPGAGSVVIVVQNLHASAVFNGTLKIAFVSFEN